MYVYWFFNKFGYSSNLEGANGYEGLEQMFNGVEWVQLDYLIIDLPPGTGDAQLSLAQSSKLSGSIIISTPQDVALDRCSQRN